MRVYSILLILSIFVCCDDLDLYKFASDTSLGPRFLTFSINNVSGKIDVSSRKVYVNTFAGTDLRTLTPVFTFYGVDIQYNNASVASGTLTLDFTSPQVFTILDKYGTKLEYTVTVENAYYPELGVYNVSTIGNDAHAGTAELPVQTITEAINRAAPIFSDVRVENGTYNETIILHNGVSISGSWQNNFTDQTGFTMLNAIDPSGAIQGSGTIGTDTIISEFWINGDAAADSRAVSLINGAGPVIRKCYINGASGTDTCGIYIENANPLIERNGCISGGTGTNSSTGIFVTNASPVIRNNIISSGSSNISYGIVLATAGQTVIQNNNIEGGSSGGSNSTGIFISGQNPYIDNNIIFDNSGTTTKYGIFEAAGGGTCDPVNLRCNNISLVPINVGAVYHDDGINDLGSADWATVIGIINGNLVLAPNFNASCITSQADLFNAGIDLFVEGYGFRVDLPGVARPVGTGWSIGAHEL